MMARRLAKSSSTNLVKASPEITAGVQSVFLSDSAHEALLSAASTMSVRALRCSALMPGAPYTPLEAVWDRTAAHLTLAGHNHLGFPPTERRGRLFYNPVALVRLTADPREWAREVKVVVVEVTRSGIELRDVPLANAPPAREALRPGGGFDPDALERQARLRAFVEAVRQAGRKPGEDVLSLLERLAQALAAERDAILNQLAEGVIVTDIEGRIIFVNAAATRAHGVSRLNVGPDEYSQAYSLFTDDGAPYPPDQLPLARAVREGVAITDARWRIRRPDGSEVIAVGNARPLLDADGLSMGAVLTLRDETARIQAERLLAESESRFRTVADSAPAFIWMTDPQTRVVFANARYETVFGVEAGDLLEGRWLKLANPDDIEAFTETFMTAARSNARFEGLLRVKHPTLGWRWLRAEGIPRFDDAGVFQGYVGASLDVTDARRAEQDLKRVNELLEERVSEALAEKAKAEADLMHAQRMEAVGRLTGGVAHDFNNLLTVVIGALDLILRSPEDAARRKKLGEAALSAARRGERLTHQLLAFSRRQALRPEAIDLNALIREGEPLLRRAVGDAIEFRLKLRRGGARVSVDPAQFEAALLNLIVNARDALGDTGKVTVETMNCAVKADEVRELEAGDYVCVTVTDDGTGMDEATQGRVFEPFFTTKAVGKGTGLGLSQVYGFARQSGGGVHIRSAPGEGTTISIYLPPLAADQALAPTLTRRDGGDTSRDRRVLLVEDDPGVSAIAVELLEGLGYAVEAVESGPAALEALALGGFDAMLSDVVMPGGMSGIELAGLVGRHYPTLRVALTSGYAGDDVDAALADAPWPFLRKPYSRDQLRDTMDALTA